MAPLYPASFFLAKYVTGFIIQGKMKLSEEDADIVSKYFNVFNYHSTMKDMFFFLSLAPLAKYKQSQNLWWSDVNMVLSCGGPDVR